MKRANAIILATILSGAAGHGALVSDAQAVIGRPLTPMSYAGVARRTTRRAAAVSYGAAYHGAYYGSPYYGGVAALPTGCARTYVGGVVHYACGGTYYRPYYDGPNLIYVPVE